MFDVLITVDRAFEYEQNLAGRKTAVLILCPSSIALKDLIPLVPECLSQLASIQAGQTTKISPLVED
jgi:hypothetical protein